MEQQTRLKSIALPHGCAPRLASKVELIIFTPIPESQTPIHAMYVFIVGNRHKKWTFLYSSKQTMTDRWKVTMDNEYNQGGRLSEILMTFELPTQKSFGHHVTFWKLKNKRKQTVRDWPRDTNVH